MDVGQLLLQNKQGDHITERRIYIFCVPLEDVWSVSRSRQNTDWTHPVESVDTTAVPTSGKWYT